MILSRFERTHPMRLLAPAFQFRQRLRETRLLRDDEAGKVEWVGMGH